MCAALAILLTAASASWASAADCVVFLHGLARTSRSMAPIAEAFADRGYQVANVDYPSRHHPIEALADIAVGEGLRRCRPDDEADVHFVTHSLGGILVRYYLAQHRPSRLGRVVMLAPPNQGSEVVDVFGKVPGFALLNGPAGLQLGTGSASIPRQLGAVDYPVGIIAGTRSFNLMLSTALPDPDDGKVSVESTKVAGMSDFVAIPVSHTFIMAHEDAIAQAIAFVERGAFVSR